MELRERMIFLSYCHHTGLFHVLNDTAGFDAAVTTALAAAFQVTVLAINTHCQMPDRKSGELRIKVACVSPTVLCAERAEQIKQKALSFIFAARRIGGEASRRIPVFVPLPAFS